MHDGSRKVTFVSEVLPLDSGGAYQSAHMAHFQHQGKDADGKILGEHLLSEKPPRFWADAKAKGYGESKDLLVEAWG